MIHLARHQEEAEKMEHPLNRIINIEDDDHGVVINTTDIHLPRRIGEAIKRAFHGEIEDHFEKEGVFCACRVDERGLTSRFGRSPRQRRQAESRPASAPQDQDSGRCGRPHKRCQSRDPG